MNKKIITNFCSSKLLTIVKESSKILHYLLRNATLANIYMYVDSVTSPRFFFSSSLIASPLPPPPLPDKCSNEVNGFNHTREDVNRREEETPHDRHSDHHHITCNSESTNNSTQCDDVEGEIPQRTYVMHMTNG